MDVITVSAWMLCLNGWSWGGRYHGSGMDAVRERMESVPAWMLCMKDGVGLDFISVPAWMLCASGWGRSGRYHGPGMDALRERMGSGWTIVRLWSRAGSYYTVPPWMLCGNGWGLAACARCGL